MLKKFLVISFLILGLTGCASVGIVDSSLRVEITPSPVERGKPALAEINAPMEAEKVVGTVMVFGSPQLLFRKNEEKNIWYFYGTIPFSPWVKPGSYRVRVLVYLPKGSPRYTEIKVDLK